MSPTEFLRNRNIVNADKTDLIIGFDNGTKESLIQLLDEYANIKLKEICKWIPISEKLPSNFSSVLVRDNSVSPIRSIALFEDGKFYPDFSAIKNKDVTHWRPIELSLS